LIEAFIVLFVQQQETEWRKISPVFKWLQRSIAILLFHGDLTSHGGRIRETAQIHSLPSTAFSIGMTHEHFVRPYGNDAFFQEDGGREEKGWGEEL